jgi:ATP-dependent helicase/nuclease subunit A
MSITSLTSEQKQAATTIDRSIGIVANAGSGKTRVLVERVAHILDGATARLSQVLVVTFTEKAAQELKTRLAERLPQQRLELMTAPITTFHGFAMRVLRDHAPTLGLSPSFQIASEGEAATLLYRAVEETVLALLDGQDPHAVYLCQRFKFRRLLMHLIPLLEDRWSFRQYISQSGHQLADRGDGVISAIITAFLACDAHYADLKRAHDVLDFHDLEIMTWQLFQDDPRILTDYQRQFRHILVDEFQDTNPLQAAIIQQLFTPPDNVLCIVGDPKQSIYRFRRADVGCFSEMLTTITNSGGEAIVLSDNFRSAPPIIDFINAVCAEMPHYTPLIAQKSTPSFPAILPIPLTCPEEATAADRRHLEAEAILEKIPELSKVHGGLGNITCLFQTRTTLQLWADRFRLANIPVHVYSSGGFWEHPEIRALLFPLHVIVGLQTGHPDERHLLAMLVSPLFSISLDEIYRWMHMKPNIGTSDLPPLHRAVFAHSPIGTRLTIWLQYAETHTPHELMMRIVADTHVSSQPVTDAFLRRLHLMGRARALPLSDFLNQLVELQHLNERTPDTPAAICHDEAIQMMTIHAAKGNEFSCVILGDLFRRPSSTTPTWIFEPGLGFAVRQEDELTPGNASTAEWDDMRTQYQSDELSERERLLYVALTRAQRQLVLPIHTDLITDSVKKGNWHDHLSTIARHGQ